MRVQIEGYIERRGNVLKLGRHLYTVLRVEHSMALPRLLIRRGADALIGLPLRVVDGEGWQIMRSSGSRLRRLASFVLIDGQLRPLEC